MSESIYATVTAVKPHIRRSSAIITKQRITLKDQPVAQASVAQATVNFGGDLTFQPQECSGSFDLWLNDLLRVLS